METRPNILSNIRSRVSTGLLRMVPFGIGSKWICFWITPNKALEHVTEHNIFIVIGQFACFAQQKWRNDLSGVLESYWSRTRGNDGSIRSKWVRIGSERGSMKSDWRASSALPLFSCTTARQMSPAQFSCISSKWKRSRRKDASDTRQQYLSKRYDNNESTNMWTNSLCTNKLLPISYYRSNFSQFPTFFYYISLS